MELDKQLSKKVDVQVEKNSLEFEEMQGKRKIAAPVSDDVNLKSQMEHKERPSAPEKGERARAHADKKSQTKIEEFKDFEEAAEFDVQKIDNKNLPAVKLAAEANNVDKVNDKISGEGKSANEVTSHEMVIAPEQLVGAQPTGKAAPTADSKRIAPENMKLSKEKMEVQAVAFESDGITAKEDSLLLIQKKINSFKNVEEKILFLKSCLNRFPRSAFKNEVIYLLAENLLSRAEATGSENFTKEAIEFFYQNEKELKTCAEFSKLEDKIKELETN